MTKPEDTTAAGAVGSPLQQGVRRAVAVARWAGLVGAGLLLWLIGLVVLDVPGALEQWRHAAGAVLLVCAVHLWRRACL
jgi:hypothetical protein